ncbi:penicillin acylase family protein [Methylosinus sp. Ce-a6]|uniref:penicillin acylase family protein n=1 Tax=Methylosinus sp. Ce-a6 TaxID=2172005 RepID=UPI001FCE5D62|nr:penicillin acylase family protein [Methylosinus sp. Ce-a6]
MPRDSAQTRLVTYFFTRSPCHFLRSVLTKSAQRLSRAHGGRSVADIRWGDVNRVEMAHPFADALPVLASFLTMPRTGLAGCPQCVRYYFAENGKGSGANARMVVAPGREADGLMQMAAGQSGQLLSDHYADQQSDWVAGRSSPFRRADLTGSIMLKPTSLR